jgi:hypothetical protein
MTARYPGSWRTGTARIRSSWGTPIAEIPVAAAACTRRERAKSSKRKRSHLRPILGERQHTAGIHNHPCCLGLRAKNASPAGRLLQPLLNDREGGPDVPSFGGLPLGRREPTSRGNGPRRRGPGAAKGIIIAQTTDLVDQSAAASKERGPHRSRQWFIRG